jgi:ParB family chromosome partitioning protein
MGFGQQAAYGAGVANEHRPLSDLLVRNLTAYGTLGLRLDLTEQPDIATTAVTHALAAQIFYVGANEHVVGIQPVKTRSGCTC